MNTSNPAFEGTLCLWAARPSTSRWRGRFAPRHRRWVPIGRTIMFSRGIGAAVLLVLWATAYSASADTDCGGIVYGKDWAFVFATPDRWTSLCRAEKAIGAALALWPRETTFADAPAVMYVTVSEKNEPTLQEFAADEQQHFRSTALNVTVRAEMPMVVGGGQSALVFHLSGDPGQNHELVSYVEGPTKYFIIAISARSAESLEQYRGAFIALMKSFVPMEAKID